MNRKHLLCLLLAAVLLCCSTFGQRVESSAETPAPSAIPAATEALISEDPPAAAEPSVPDAPGRRTIRIFETTDIHGYLLDTTGGEEAKFQYRLAYIARIVNEARADGQYDDVLLVDGGDLYQGMPVSNMSMGAAMVAALDAMDYDAVAPLDNPTLILYLRQEARDNEGYIAVDLSPRSTCIQGEVPATPT